MITSCRKTESGTLLATIILALMFAVASTAAFAADNSGVFKGLLSDQLKGQANVVKTQTQQSDSAVSRRIPFSQKQIQLSFAPLVKETAPAVVNVYAARMVQARSPFAGDPFFQQFFGGGTMPPRVQKSLGSGVIVDPSGIIVTNYHVIRDADEVKVAMSDGREFESEILLADESVDLAVLKIKDGKPFPALKFGDSDALEVGDLVLAIGDPFGVGQTTTSGIVSALARTNVGASDLGFFIQTDAAINPGNSGGALIDMDGRLVGINSSIYTRSGGSNGIGFAIPANLVKAVVASAKLGSKLFERPWLGVDFQEVTPAIAESLGLDRPAGALVGNVMADSPADKAGIKPGDLILSINGADIQNSNALEYRLATREIGATVQLGVLRRGQEFKINVKLEREPKDSGIKVSIEGQSPFAGTVVSSLGPRLARQLGIRPGTNGVVITDIKSNSPADRFGFLPGDIIREVNGETISKPQDLADAAQTRSRWWKFTLERNGQVIRQVLRY
jgi:Do/DeqQ family serine protease